MGSSPNEFHIFHLFRCVLSSVLLLRSVGRSNFDKGLHNLTTLIKKRHYCTKSYFNVSVSKPSTLCITARNMANIDLPSFIAELSSDSEFSSVDKANQYRDFLRTVLDLNARPSRRKEITHNSSPWIESIRN